MKTKKIIKHFISRYSNQIAQDIANVIAEYEWQEGIKIERYSVKHSEKGRSPKWISKKLNKKGMRTPAGKKLSPEFIESVIAQHKENLESQLTNSFRGYQNWLEKQEKSVGPFQAEGVPF